MGDNNGHSTMDYTTISNTMGDDNTMRIYKTYDAVYNTNVNKALLENAMLLV